MKSYSRISRLLLLPLAAALGLQSGTAQVNSAIPLPFVTTIAGLPTGSTNVACSMTSDIPNQSGQHLGDGCLPTQATLLTLYDTQTDAAGDVYITENGTNNDIRVIYNGGATLAKVLAGANPTIANFTPGRIYTVAGGTASALTAVNKVYYCGNVTNGQQSTDLIGDSCPAAQSYIKPRGAAVDKYGNIYTVSNGSGEYIRVVYAGGTQVANLITTENPGVTPQVGYIYKIAGTSSAGYKDNVLGTSAQFIQLRYIAVDTIGNVFVSDGNTQSGTAPNIYEVGGNNVRRIDAITGFASTVAGENTCVYSSTTGCPYGATADNVPAAGALLSTPYAIFLDANNNLYIADYYNSKIRVVYEGGTVAGISGPMTVGNIYTFAGGGTLAVNGTPANQVKFANLYVGGIDPAGNVYAEDGTSKVIFKFDAKTAMGEIVAGGGVSGTTRPGAYCAGTAGPLSNDDYDDGCPGPQAALSDTGHITFDNSGNFYLAENGNAIVREASYNNQFGAAADGTVVTHPVAFEALAAATLTGETFTLQGAATAEYADAGSDTCASNAALVAGTICVYYVSFDPAHDGQRQGSLQLTTATGAAVTEALSGTGVASDIAIDTGTESTVGTGIKPNGVAADLLGNVYVADTTGNRVLKGAASGTMLTPVVTGLNHPAGVAVDGFGNIYVADTGNNRVLEASSTGVTIASLGTGLTAPQGVAVDGLGNIYVADTGNNRILQLFLNGNQQLLNLTGLSAPTQLAVDTAGDLFVVDSGNKRIVEYSGGVQTIPTLDAAVVPAGVAVDPAGTLYVADSAGLRLLAYPAGAATGNLLVSGLVTPVALAADADANLFVADTSETGVTELRRSLGNIVFPLTNVGQTTTESISVSNAGNAGLMFPSAPLVTVTGSPLFTVAPASSNGCGTGTTYASGAGCNFTASFAPLATGMATATVKFNTNATNTSTASALLSGNGLLLTSTTTSLTVSPTGTIYFGQTVVLTAKLTPSTTTTTPTGTFTFTIDGKTQSPQAIGNGTATLTLATLLAGAHSVSITYSGDGTYASSAATVNFTVNQAVTTTTLTVVPVNNAGALSLLFTATVTSPTATGETGTVSFYAGTALLATSTVNAAGVATYSSASLAFAVNSFTAVYSGNANFAGSTSTAFLSVGSFTLGYPSTAVGTSQGGVANISFTVASLFGATGTVTPTCTGLPAYSVCRFQPETIPLGSTPQTEAILIYTNVPNNLASNEMPSFGRGISLALGIPLGISLLLLRRRSKLTALAMLALGVVLTTGLSGCGSSNKNVISPIVTPAGAYSVNFVFTGSNGLSGTQTVPAIFTVTQDSGSF